MRLLPLESLRVIVLPPSSRASSRPSSVRMIFRAGVVAAPVSSLGSWPLPHQQPVQMGRDTSPDSNSIHTPASAAGTV